MGSWLRYNFAAGSFQTMKLCSRLLMLFVEICPQNYKFGHLNPILGKLEVTHDLVWWLVGKPIVDFLFALIELFRYLLLFRSYEAKCAQLVCFYRGSTYFHSNFTSTWSSPSAVLGVRKLETLGYSMVKTAFLCVPSFWHNTGVWRTDGQTVEFAIAYTALAKLALRRDVQIQVIFSERYR